MTKKEFDKLKIGSMIVCGDKRIYLVTKILKTSNREYCVDYCKNIRCDVKRSPTRYLFQDAVLVWPSPCTDESNCNLWVIPNILFEL